MAYVDPQSVNNPTAGATLPAAWGDTVRDDLEWLARNKPHCRVYNNAAVSIPDATRTAITFNSERVDVGGMHSTVSNTSRITIPSGADGWYSIGGCIEFASVNTTGIREGDILLNGSTLIAIQQVPGFVQVQQCNPSCYYQLVAGDYVELTAFQSSGGALNVDASSAYSPEFWATWVAL